MTTSATPQVGRRVELGRYHIPSGPRVLFGQRIDGHVRVTDVPTDGGRSYLVERELEEDGNAAMQALVADYIAQSERRGEPAIIVNLNQLTASP